MGQYFNVITKDLTGKVSVYNGESPESMKEINKYFAGLEPEDIKRWEIKIEDIAGCNKLLEHLWWGDKFVGRLCRKILNHPTQIAFVGEYAMGYREESNIPNGLEMEVIEVLFDAVWKRKNERIAIEDVPMLLLDEEEGYFLVNHSKKTFVDCKKYRKQFEDEDEGAHLLPLLTAVGNNLDWYGYEGTDVDKVGSWAYDLISVETSIPEMYIEEQFCFKE